MLHEFNDRKEVEDLIWALKNKQGLGIRREKWKPLQKTEYGMSVEGGLRSKQCGQCDIEWVVSVPGLEASQWETGRNKVDWLTYE